MSEMVAYCGLVCKTCPIYLATRVQDPAEQRRRRTEIARLCREQYGMDYRPEDIADCDGCRTDGGRLFTACTTCPIRGCAWQKGVETCAQCDQYACEQLKTFFASEPTAKGRLDKIRSSLQK